MTCDTCDKCDKYCGVAVHLNSHVGVYHGAEDLTAACRETVKHGAETAKGDNIHEAMNEPGLSHKKKNEWHF